MPFLFFALLALGLLLLWASRRQRARTGLPEGRVIFFDTEDLARTEQALYDPATDLVGRPDYVVRRSEGLIPVEVKSGRTPRAPYDSHILQLAAYCLLAEAVYGERPPYGVIKYPKRSFAIDYDSALETGLREVIAELRAQEEGEPDRSHESFARCRACGYRHVCDQRLA